MLFRSYEVYPNEDPNEPPRKIRHLWFRALIAERTLAPDGSFFPIDGEALRRRLIRILREEKDLTLTTRAGTISGLYGKDHVVIRSIYAEAETFENSSQHAEPERSSTRREGYLARRSAQRAVPLGNGRLAIAPFPSI